MKQINEFFGRNKFDYARPMPKDEFEAWLEDIDKSIRDHISKVNDHYMTHIWKHINDGAHTLYLYGLYVHNDSTDAFEKIAEYDLKKKMFYCKKSDKKKFGF